MTSHQCIATCSLSGENVNLGIQKYSDHLRLTFEPILDSSTSPIYQHLVSDFVRQYPDQRVHLNTNVILVSQANTLALLEFIQLNWELVLHLDLPTHLLFALENQRPITLIGYYMKRTHSEEDTLEKRFHSEAGPESQSEYDEINKLLRGLTFERDCRKQKWTNH